MSWMKNVPLKVLFLGKLEIITKFIKMIKDYIQHIWLVPNFIDKILSLYIFNKKKTATIYNWDLLQLMFS